MRKSLLKNSVILFYGISFSITCFCQEKQPLTFFVATNGYNTNSGSKSSPFQTLEDARNAIDKIKGPLNAIVNVMGGIYHLSKSFIIAQTESDSSRQITYTNYGKEKVIMAGSLRLESKNFQLVKDAEVLSRLPSIARGNVYETNLNEDGITDYGKMVPHGYKSISPAPLELFYNGLPLTVARWPNKGMVPIGTVIDPGPNIRNGEKGNRGGKFVFNEDRISNWRTADNAWIGGIFSFGYSDDYLKVDTFDFINKTIRLRHPATYRIFSNNDASDIVLKNAQAVRGFYLYNLLEELDTPGEWYLDEKTSKLYFWPPDNLINSADIEVSQLADPIVVLSHTNNITFKGIEFAYSRGMGLLVENTVNTQIVHCVFDNLGTVGISTGNQLNKKKIEYHTVQITEKETILYNTNLLIQSCSIFNMGTGGIILNGGDRKRLIPANNIVDNCEIYNYSRINRTYCPAVSIDGVGNQLIHCYIHDAPDQAVLYSGNNHLISYNHIKNVVANMTDAGAIYTEKDVSALGTVISYNFFDSIAVNSNASVSSIYFDDGIGGMSVNSNIFFKACASGEYKFGAVHINGGANCSFSNNYFINCEKAFVNAQWNDKQWKDFITNPGIIKLYAKDVNVYADVYRKTYPQLIKLLDSTVIGVRQNFSFNTLSYNVTTFSSGSCYVHKNVFTTNQDPGFEDANNGIFSLLKYPKALEQSVEWKPIPFSDIGLRK